MLFLFTTASCSCTALSAWPRPVIEVGYSAQSITAILQAYAAAQRRSLHTGKAVSSPHRNRNAVYFTPVSEMGQT